MRVFWEMRERDEDCIRLCRALRSTVIRRVPPRPDEEWPRIPSYTLGPVLPLYDDDGRSQDLVCSFHDDRDILSWVRTVWGNRQHELDALRGATVAEGAKADTKARSSV